MAKKQTGSKPKGNLVKELDAAIALLTRVRTLAVAGETAEATSSKAVKTTASKKPVKRVLSTSAREAIAAAQKKRWAKVRRQKKQAERAALAK
jgi:hypothetical protein